MAVHIIAVTIPTCSEFGGSKWSRVIAGIHLICVAWCRWSQLTGVFEETERRDIRCAGGGGLTGEVPKLVDVRGGEVYWKWTGRQRKRIRGRVTGQKET